MDSMQADSTPLRRVRPARLQWAKDRCTACLSCVIVCSERHTGESAPSRARIRLHIDLLGGSDDVMQYCRQCAKAPCASACPVEAIHFDQQTQVWLVDDAVCDGCGQCVRACPFGAIWIDPAVARAIKCDLCGGRAWCVEACPAGALTVSGREVRRDDGK